jgi:hypothetical protein
MSEPQAPSAKTELETVVNWRMIVAGAGLGAAVLAAAAFVLLSGPRATPGKEPAVTRRPAASPAIRSFALLPRSTATPAPAAPAPAAPPELLPPPTVENPAPTPPREPTRPVAAPPAPAREPTTAVARAPAPQAPSFKRLRSSTEAELVYLLDTQVTDIDLDATEGTCEELLQVAKQAPSAAQPLQDVLAKRADLKGLPVRMGEECRTAAAEARVVQDVSRAVRRARASGGRGRRGGDSYHEMVERDMAFLEDVKRVTEGRSSSAERVAVTLAQMIQADNPPVRRYLVKALGDAKGGDAGLALARRAVFDPSPEVREAAVKALADRPRKEYRDFLLGALRYPWAPAADHAAEALVALDDRESVLPLRRLLDEPDPAAPVRGKDGKWRVTELVRVNHLRNCLLCHAPSSDDKDPVRGLVPERGKPLPEVYYDSREGSFVRADIVYLRQDFSVMQPVAKAAPWPALQRFDYLTRRRELTAEEVERLPPAKGATAPHAYPQRHAVSWALRQLTGEDAGED